MKRITIEIPDGYDDVVSITAVGSVAKSETCRTTNLMTRIEDITEHDGDVLVLVEKGDTEWRKPEKLTAYWMWHEANNYWACSQCGRAAISTGYGQDRSEYCPRCGRKMVV